MSRTLLLHFLNDNIEPFEPTKFSQIGTCVGKYSVFGQFLKEKRVLAGLSQKEVADKLSYSSGQFISDWERGLANPPLKVVRKLAKMYSVPDDVIFEMMLEATIQVMRTEWEAEYYGRSRRRKA